MSNQQLLNDLVKAKLMFQKRAIMAAMEINPNTILMDSPCPKCGQVPEGKGGEYPCLVCGLPTEHDEEPANANV